MAQDTMTTRERILGTLRQEEVDRFPVWLKKGGPDYLKSVGCDVFAGCGFGAKVERPHVTVTVEEKNGDIITTYDIKGRKLTGVDTRDPGSHSTHPTKFCIESKEDLDLFRWVYTDCTYSVDDESIEVNAAQFRECEENDYATRSGIGPSPYMHLIQHLIGPVNTIYLQYDEPDLFGEVIDIMHQARVNELAAILPRIKTDTFWLTENTSTTLMSPEIFQQYCMPQLKIYGQMVLDNGLIPVHHMCGTLYDLLEMIDELPAMANEAFTTPPVGNTTLRHGRERMPSKSLIGGTNASLWLKDADEIIEEVTEDLASCPNTRGVFLTSAGVLPPAVSDEKATKVVAAFKNIPFKA